MGQKKFFGLSPGWPAAPDRNNPAGLKDRYVLRFIRQKPKKSTPCVPEFTAFLDCFADQGFNKAKCAEAAMGMENCWKRLVSNEILKHFL